MQLGVCLTPTAGGQARPGCSFGCDRLARPCPMQRWMQLGGGLPGPRWVGCSLERASPTRPEVRHDLDAASGATALLGPAPWQIECSLLRGCQALGGLDAALRAPHQHGPRPGTTWMQLRVRPPCASPPRPEVRHDLDAASGATASLGLVPCKDGCSLVGACRALGGLDAAWNAPQGWMQLGVCLTTTARDQARPGCSFGCDRLARPGPVAS